MTRSIIRMYAPIIYMSVIHPRCCPGHFPPKRLGILRPKRPVSHNRCVIGEGVLEFQPKRPWATPLGVLCPSSQRADHSFHVEASEARLERKHKRFRSKVSQSNYSAAPFCKHKGAARGSKFSSHKLFTTINKNKIILRIIHFKSCKQRYN